MIGILITNDEKEEIVYLLKREMDEILFDINDPRMEQTIIKSMEVRYKTLFNLFKRVASEYECMNYILRGKKSNG
ncbi:hypothetical protein [Bacillus sp. FSL K6-3431]|uniref:hypothetical protein n=1 Tax=Bacillus sp. FSL K6-3431 TaxID=2921500 RepID=UPI0030F742FD